MALTCKIGGVQYAALDLMSVQIGLPAVKTQSESVPGADGELDLTAALTGVPVFGNRQIKLRFGFAPGAFDFYSFAAAVHGQRLKLELSNKAGYYIGRYTVGTPDTSLDKTTFDVTIDADPYRLEAEETSITIPMLAESSNLMIGNTPTAIGSSSSVDEYFDVVGSGADSVLRIKSVATADNIPCYGFARFELPWPASGSCLISADAEGGWYTIVDANGMTYGDGASRWIPEVPAGGLYIILETNNPSGCTVNNIRIFRATPGSTAGLRSDRLLFPRVDSGDDVLIARCNRTSPVVRLRAGETGSPYLSVRRETDYAYAVGSAAGEVTLSGVRGWM